MWTVQRTGIVVSRGIAALLALAIVGCGGDPGVGQGGPEHPAVDFAIAIHGGAGVIPRDLAAEQSEVVEELRMRAQHLHGNLLRKVRPRGRAEERIFAPHRDEATAER